MPFKTLLRGCKGLNNRVDPVRLQYDPQTGMADLAEAVNCYIDDTGRIRRRPGQTAIDATAEYHSLYCNGGDAFVVKERTSDAAIYQIATDFSLTGVRSGLVQGARTSFWTIGTKTYYTNGYQNGVIESGTSTAWPSNTHVGISTDRYFDTAPLGTHICMFQGRMWVVVGGVIWVSEPYAYGKFRLAGTGFQFASDVRMIKPVKTGVFVSDSTQTGFIAAAEEFKAMTWQKKSDFPAHEWSEAHRLKDLGQTVLQIPGLSAIWSSDEGLCVGTETGEIVVVTENKLDYPIGSMGATVWDDNLVINTIY